MTHAAAQTEPRDYGRRLHQFLQHEWDVLGVTRGAWCRQSGLPDSTVHRWGTGIEPTMANLRLVAAALHRPLVEVLVAVGYLEPADREHLYVESRQHHRVDRALHPVSQGGDDSISEPEREALRALWEVLKQARSAPPGRSRRVRRTVDLSDAKQTNGKTSSDTTKTG